MKQAPTERKQTRFVFHWAATVSAKGSRQGRKGRLHLITSRIGERAARSVSSARLLTAFNRKKGEREHDLQYTKEGGGFGPILAPAVRMDAVEDLCFRTVICSVSPGVTALEQSSKLGLDGRSNTAASVKHMQKKLYRMKYWQH